MDANITLMLREARIAEGQLHSSHYLKTVTKLGDGRQVLAMRDMFSSQGLKLVPKGTPFNSTLYQRLLNHKLVPKLDDSLATEDGVTNATLMDEARVLIASEESLVRMRNSLPDDQVLMEVLARIPLKPTIAFKLTVMSAQRKELFQRTLYVTLVCIYIGIQKNLDKAALVRLATAALLHDIGLLHVDPQLLDHAYRMSREDRQHLFAHPITAWMILKDDPDYGGDIAEAVLQHHEHLDGSGYPQGLSGDALGLFGQIITLAEVAVSHFGKDEAHLHPLRLETILKLNARRYGRHLIGHLKVFYATEPSAAATLTEDEKHHIHHNLHRFSEIFQAWEARRRSFAGKAVGEFINERMQALKMEALDAGLNVQAPEDVLKELASDAEAAAQLRVLLDEILFQVHAISREINRRWPKQEEDSLSESDTRAWMEIAENREKST